MTKVKIIVIVASIVIVLCAGSFVGGYFFRGEQIHNMTKEVIVTVDKPVYRTIKTPMTPEEKQACIDSKIMMEYVMRWPSLTVKAHDMCKETEQSILIKPPFEKNVLILNAVVLYDFRSNVWSAGGQPQYYRMFNSLCGLGGGVIGTNRQIGFNIGGVLKW